MSAIELPSPEIKCPTCGGPTAHRNEGIHWCQDKEGCRGFVNREIPCDSLRVPETLEEFSERLRDVSGLDAHWRA